MIRLRLLLRMALSSSGSTLLALHNQLLVALPVHCLFCTSLLAGAADQPEAVAEDGEPAEADPDKPALPAWPKYEGLKYESGAVLPCSQADVPFPPPAAAVAAI
jgi:hypothetical protein